MRKNIKSLIGEIFKKGIIVGVCASTLFLAGCVEENKESLDKQILELKENSLINKDVFILSDESVDKGNALIESLNGKLVIGIDDVIGKIKEELL